jgi:hypothetical protein
MLATFDPSVELSRVYPNPAVGSVPAAMFAFAEDIASIFPIRRPATSCPTGH